MFTIICLLLLIYIFYRFFFSYSSVNTHGKYVLITGCDSGFGHTLAIELDKQGFNVLASVYIPESVVLLTNKLSLRATVFCLDTTKQADIDAAFELVQTKTNSLHALVNNAGIATGGYIDWTSIDTMRTVMDVNFFGHVAVTKTFLSLLIAKRNSRVVNMSSMCGYLSLPGSSAYCSSKYSLEAFSDCLRREMTPWNLHVSIIEPGTMRTPMTECMERFLKDVWLRSSTNVRERWGEQFFDDLLQVIIKSPFIRYSESPEKVIRSLKHAIMSNKPQIRYRPGWQSGLFFYPLSLLPVWIVDQILSLGYRVSPAGVKNQLIN